MKEFPLRWTKQRIWMAPTVCRLFGGDSSKCKPGLATAFIFTLFLAWNDFLVALLLTSTNAKTFYCRPGRIFYPAYNLDLGPMSGAFLFSFPVMIISLAAQKYIVQGMTARAVKG